MNESKDTGPNKSGTSIRTVAKQGAAPTVTARRPISKEEYARTTKESADRTSVIPAITEDAPAPDAKTVAAPAAKVEVADAAGVTESDAKTTSKKSAAAKDAAKATETAKVAPKTPVPPPTPSGLDSAVPGSPAVTIPEAVEETAVQPAVVDEPAAVPVKAEPETGPTAKSGLAQRRAVRRKLTYVDPWSASKMAFVVSVALMIVSVVAVTVFWFVLQVTGVWEALNDSVTNVLSDGSGSFDVTDYVGLGRMVGLALVVSALNVVFMTALATIAAHLYNMAASMLGGVEVTFQERS